MYVLSWLRSSGLFVVGKPTELTAEEAKMLWDKQAETNAL